MNTVSCMRCRVFFAFALVAAELSAAGLSAGGPAPAEHVAAGRKRKLDAHWLFTRGDPAGAEKSDFSDSAWRTLDLPHDWSIEGPVDSHNSTGPRGGYLPAGIGWYRKHFTIEASGPGKTSDMKTLDAAEAGKCVLIQFDGVMANSDVYINGFKLGHRPYGWVSFQYDLTGHVSFGPDRPNVLAVRVDNSRQPASRFYEGAGIYRHVWISVVDQVHLAQGGVYITTPVISAEQATVKQATAKIAVTLENRSAADREVTVRARVAPAEVGWHVPEPQAKGVNGPQTRPSLEAHDVPPSAVSDPARTTVRAGKTAEVECSCVVQNPEVWDLDHPRLYHATVELVSDGRTIDSQTVSFGIRQADFRADTGFWLNGRNLKLLGACVHSECGAFGTAVPDSEWRTPVLPGSSNRWASTPSSHGPQSAVARFS